MKKSSKVAVLGLVVFAGVSLIGAMNMQTEPKHLAGGWSALAAKDERVMDAARFAVTTQSAVSKAQIQLVAVVEASSQVVAGTNYAMTLEVLHDGASQKVRTIVWVKLDGAYELMQWSWH